MTQRQSQILLMISEKGRINVATLAENMDVSVVTIRKDLTALEEKGLIKRQHGFAVMNAETDINNRLAIRYNIKQNIAERAAHLVDDGDVILIESGSCCYMLAKLINQQKKNVTIITYSAYIATHIDLNNGNQLILLGGLIMSETKNLVGPVTLAALQNFSVGKFFSGTDGLSADGNFTAKDIMIAEIIRAMNNRAINTYVLTDSTKFSHQGTVSSFHASNVNTVFTDDKISPKTRFLLEKYGVRVDTGEE